MKHLYDLDLLNRYFDWLCDIVKNGERSSYHQLLRYLFKHEFNYILGLDSNRAEDGIDLRYRFIIDTDICIKDAVISTEIDNRPSSLLEMMVALSLRIEENIMGDCLYGDRTSKWFWTMVNSLGLGAMDDSSYDRSYVASCIKRFENREYTRYGQGGLFTIHDHSIDMRSVEIWYQAMYYLDELE